MRRHCKTREQRLDTPRNALSDALQVCGQYWRTDSGFWGWQSNSGQVGLADTARRAIDKCVSEDRRRVGHSPDEPADSG